MNKNNSIIFFDMDGVMAKWQQDGKWQEEGYYRTLEPEQKIIDLILKLKATGYEVAILSAVPSVNAEMDKIAWLGEHGLGDIMHVFVPYGSSKAEAIDSLNELCTPMSKILIDDYSQNLHDWDKAGNRAIKFRNGINGTKGTWIKDSISYNQSIEEMYEVIVA